MAFLAGWLFFVLFPAVLSSSRSAVRLAGATLGAESVPFLRHCPAPVLVVHLQTYAALLPAVLLLVWGHRSLIFSQRRLDLGALSRPLAQGLGLLAVTQLSMALYAVVTGWNARVTVAWSLRLLGYDVLAFSMLMLFVLALTSRIRRYTWVVLLTLAVALLQSGFSWWLTWQGLGPWLPSQLLLRLSSGDQNSAQLVFGLVAWVLVSLALLALGMWPRFRRVSAPPFGANGLELESQR